MLGIQSNKIFQTSDRNHLAGDSLSATSPMVKASSLDSVADAVGALLFLVVVSLLASWWMSPHFLGFGGDVEVYRYIGMMIRHGGIPYVDVFDHKPPLIYFAAALVDPMGPWGMWSFMVIAAAFSSWLFFLAARKCKFPFPLLGPVLFILGFRSQWVVFLGGCNTRELAACLVMTIFAVNLWRPKLLWFWNGLLVTALFFAQQNEILGVFPLMLLQFWTDPEKKEAASAFVLGAAATAVPILGYLAWKGAFAAFIQDAFLFNFQKYMVGAGPLTTRIAAAWSRARTLNFVGLFIAAISVIALTHLISKSREPYRVFRAAVIAGFFMQLTSIAMSGHLGDIYFEPMVVYLVLTIGFAAKGIADLPWDRSGKWAAYAAGVGALMFLPDYAHHPLKPHLKQLIGIQILGDTPYRAEMPVRQVREALESIRGQRGQLFVLRNYHWIALYTDYDIIAPSKWIYHFFWNGLVYNWDRDGRIFRSILEDIDHHKTRYILDYSDVLSFMDPERKVEWNAYIAPRYELVYTDPKEGWKFWKRKGL